MMFSIGDKIIYGEYGVCTVDKIGPLGMAGAPKDKLYYELIPLVGSGRYYTPVESGAYMRPVISRDEAEALIDSIPDIEPAICSDSRFNHVDAFYRELFRQHTCEALVAIVKGLHIRVTERKSRGSRAELTLKRALDTLHGELAVALDMDIADMQAYIIDRIGWTE